MKRSVHEYVLTGCLATPPDTELRPLSWIVPPRTLLGALASIWTSQGVGTWVSGSMLARLGWGSVGAIAGGGLEESGRRRDPDGDRGGDVKKLEDGYIMYIYVYVRYRTVFYGTYRTYMYVPGTALDTTSAPDGTGIVRPT